MLKQQITIKDLARILNVSVSTISRALKDHPDISDKTKKAVVELAEKLNYRPNEWALSLKKQKSHIIGVMVPEMVHHFFSSVIGGIESIAYNLGYQIMIFHSNESYEREVLLTEALLSYRLDGLIVSMTKQTKNFDHFRMLENAGIPIVYFDRIIDEMESNKVVFDDFNAAFHVVEHLVRQGCKKIVHLAGPENMPIARERKNGFLNALETFNLPVKEQFIFHCDNYEMAQEKLPELLDQYPEIDGLFAVNDLTAIGAMKAIKAKGLRIPQDVKVAGFTNEISSGIYDPPLTTVDQQGELMGKEAIKMLLDYSDSKGEIGYKTRTISYKFLPRASTLE
ncbi:MAG: LacI family DNA-binding transcriptional regulator [Bacteroidales bacterium]|nr:LacI family DNA-binding transcriptional regulator [Bacteroidales bacterium]